MAITVTKRDSWADSLPGAAQIIASAIAAKRAAPKREFAEAIQFVERTGTVPDEATMHKMFPDLMRTTSYASIAAQLTPIAERAKLATELMQKEIATKEAAVKLSEAQVRQIDRQEWLDQAHKDKIYAEIKTMLDRSNLDKDMLALERDRLVATYVGMLQDARFKEAYLNAEGRARELTMQLGLHNAEVQFNLRKMELAAQMGQLNAAATSQSISQITELMKSMGETAAKLSETDSGQFNRFMPYFGEMVQLSAQQLRRLTGAADIASDPAVVRKTWKLAEVFEDLPLKLFGPTAMSKEDRADLDEAAKDIVEASGGKVRYWAARSRAFKLYLEARKKAREEARNRATNPPLLSTMPQGASQQAVPSAIDEAFDSIEASFDNMRELLNNLNQANVGVGTNIITRAMQNTLGNQQSRAAGSAQESKVNDLAIQILMSNPQLTLTEAVDQARTRLNTLLPGP